MRSPRCARASRAAPRSPGTGSTTCGLVYFNHSIHVQRGVACERCHGPVTNMVRIYQARPLAMGWCLDCHRHSCWDSLGAPAQVFEFRRQDARVPEDVGRRRAAAYEIEPGNLDSCYICHR